MCAASIGQTDVVLALVNGGANINYADMGGETALIRAVANGHTDTVKSLLDRGADANISDSKALVVAVQRGDLEAVRLLLVHGANPNAGSDFTPFHVAAVRGDEGIVEELLANGANVHAKTSVGTTAIDLAQKEGNTTVVRLLRKAMAFREIRSGRLVSWQPDDAPSTVSLVSMAPGPSIRPAPRSDIERPRYKLPENPDNFAVVVGIEEYPDLPSAQFAGRDAAAVRKHLFAMGYPIRNVIYLTNEKAGKAGLEKFIEHWLPGKVSESSRVFFYFAGHGSPDAKSGQSYLIPWDGDPDFLQATAYPLRRLYQKLAALKAKEVIVALDSCFSGRGGRSVLPKGTRPLVNQIDMEMPAIGKVVSISASAANEISGSLDDEGHGIFTYYFLKGIDGAAQDTSGRITVKSLYDYVKPHVQDSARLRNRDQTPQLLPIPLGKQAELVLR